LEHDHRDAHAVAANAVALEASPKLGHALQCDLPHSCGSKDRLDVLDQHPLVLAQGPFGKVRNGVLGPPLGGEALHGAVAPLEQCELAHGLAPTELGVEGEGVGLAREGALAA
jgi:hypothetical protein